MSRAYFKTPLPSGERLGEGSNPRGTGPHPGPLPVGEGGFVMYSRLCQSFDLGLVSSWRKLPACENRVHYSASRMLTPPFRIDSHCTVSVRSSWMTWSRGDSMVSVWSPYRTVAFAPW